MESLGTFGGCGSLILRMDHLSSDFIKGISNPGDLPYYSPLERHSLKRGRRKSVMRLCSENVARKCGCRAFLWLIVNMTVMDMNSPPRKSLPPVTWKPYGARSGILNIPPQFAVCQDIFQKKRDQISKGPLSLIHHSYYITILRGE